MAVDLVREPELVTAAADLPVSPDDIGSHLGVCIDPADYGDVEELIQAAVEKVEGDTGYRGVREQQWKLTLPSFPQRNRDFTSAFVDAPWIRLRWVPLVTLDQIDYFDEANAAQQVNVNDVWIEKSTQVEAQIRPKVTIEWPSTYERDDAVAITYTAGAVNPLANRAIKLLVGHWYDHRTAVVTGTISTEIDLAYQSIIATLSTGKIAHV